MTTYLWIPPESDFASYCDLTCQKFADYQSLLNRTTDVVRELGERDVTVRVVVLTVDDVRKELSRSGVTNNQEGRAACIARLAHSRRSSVLGISLGLKGGGPGTQPLGYVGWAILECDRQGDVIASGVDDGTRSVLDAINRINRAPWEDDNGSDP